MRDRREPPALVRLSGGWAGGCARACLSPAWFLGGQQPQAPRCPRGRCPILPSPPRLQRTLRVSSALSLVWEGEGRLSHGPGAPTPTGFTAGDTRCQRTYYRGQGGTPSVAERCRGDPKAAARPRRGVLAPRGLGDRAPWSGVRCPGVSPGSALDVLPGHSHSHASKLEREPSGPEADAAGGTPCCPL